MSSAQNVVRGGSHEHSMNPSHSSSQTLPSNLHSTPERLTAIEARLEQISATLVYDVCPIFTFWSNVEPSEFHPAQPDLSTRTAQRLEIPHHLLSALDLPEDAVSDGILLYFKHHCNQPCPLFDHLSQEPLSCQYPPIVLTAMLALSLRHSSHTHLMSTEQGYPSAEALSQRSWTLLVDAYRRFDFDESYFQALCLLAQVDYAEGISDRARTQVTLGLRLAQTRGMLSRAYYENRNEISRTKYQEIIWSLFVLDRMFTGRNVPSPSVSNTLYRLPVFLGGPTHPEHVSEIYDATNPRSSSRNFMIMSLYAQMMRIWELVISYINENLTTESTPLWHHKSPRTVILTLLLEFEIRQCTHAH